MKKLLSLFTVIILICLAVILVSCKHVCEVDHYDNKAPTCTENGYNKSVCSCGAIIEDTSVPATGHTAGDWITDKEPDCVTDGSKHKECTVCEATITTEKINALGHTLGDWITDKEPDCITDGSKHKDCTVCNTAVETETIGAAGHKYTEHAAVSKTCTTDGNEKYYTCENCSLIFDESKAVILSIPTIVASHDYVEHAAVPKTCTTDGNEKYYTCEACSLLFDENKTTITAVPTTAAGHSYVEHIAAAPTCVKEGNEHYYMCSGCSLILDGNKEVIAEIPSIAKINHTYVEHIAVKATCTEDGNELYYTCTGCTHIFNKDKEAIDKVPTVNAGHYYIEHPEITATCAREGNDLYYTCKLCDKIFDKDKKEIDAYPVIFGEHKFVEHPALAPTCTTNGHEFYRSCKNCTTYFTETGLVVYEIPVIYGGHKCVAHNAVAATCTDDGNELYYTCERCPAILNSNKIEISAIPVVYAHHNYVKHNAVNGSCIKDGNELYFTCGSCSLIFDAEKNTILSIPIIEAGNHDYTTLNKTSSDGLEYKLVICSDCKDFTVSVNNELISSEDYEKYNSVNMYKSFIGQEKEEAILNAYYEVVAKGLSFQFGEKTLEGDDAFAIYIEDFGLTADEALAVWSAIESDYPMFYWLENSVLHNSESVLYLTNSDYYTPEQRGAYNKLIFDEIDEIFNKYQGKTDFQIVKALYDMIIDGTDYAYDGSGNPSSELKAHSILGYFEGQNVVCEGYAKTLQILFNVFDIENCYVTGFAGEDHAWNYICLYGEWFLIDATWGDTDGERNNYFLVSDFKNEADNHIANDQTLGKKYHYELPELSKGTFALTTLYKNGEFLSYHATIDGAISAMNDETADYVIYLFDPTTNERYFGKKIDGSGIVCDSLYILADKIEWARSLTVIGSNQDDPQKWDMPVVIIDSNIDVNTDLTFKKVQFSLLYRTEGEGLVGQDAVIDITGSKFTFDNCLGLFMPQIYGRENSVLAFKEISGETSADVINMFGMIDVDTVTTESSSIEIYGDVTAASLVVKSGKIEFSNLNKFILVSAGIDDSSTDIKIGTVYLSEPAGSTCVEFHAPYQYEMNVDITTVIATEGKHSILCINFLHEDYYPNVTVENIVGTIMLDVLGETTFINPDGSKITESINPLLCDVTFLNYKDFGDGKIKIHANGYDITEYSKKLENGDVVSALKVDGDYILYGTTLVSYLGNDLIVNVPEGITKIASQAFFEKDMIVIVLPSTLEEIDIGFVAYCNKVTEIVNKSNIPAGSILASNGYNGIENIKKVSKEQTSFVVDGFWFIEANGEYYLFYYDGNETEIVLPDSKDIQKLNGEKYTLLAAFSENESITSIVISGSVKCIEKNAFYNCKSLATVEIEEGVEEIKDWAFSGCDKLLEIKIPNSVFSIGRFVFNGCNQLQKITLPSLCTCGKFSFTACLSLKDVYYYGTAEEFEEYFGNTGIKSYMQNLYVYTNGDWVKAN